MKFICFLVALAFFTSCSKAEQAAENTKVIKEETKQVSQNTEKTSKDTSFHIKIQRQNDSATLRSRQFDILTANNTGLGQKFSAAILMFKNFEYQLWNPDENSFDTIELRKELMADALREFYQKAGDIYRVLLQKNFWGNSRLENMSPLELDQDSDGENEKNHEMAFYALASMCHYNNIIQIRAIRAREDLQATSSIYDMIRHALLRDKNGAHLSVVDEVILSGDNKDVSIELLKARFNILLALATKDMATTEGLNFGNRFSRFWYNLTGGGIGNLTVRSNFENRNLPTQKDINYKLSSALKARAALNRAGITVEPHEDIKSMLENIKINDAAKTNTEYRTFLTYLNALTR